MGFSLSSSVKSDADNVPINHYDLTMHSNASNNSSPFPVRGDGMVSVLITLPDTNSADGDFYLQICDTPNGTYSSVEGAVVPKNVGVALASEPLQVLCPGTQWARVRFVHSAGGIASEVSLSVSIW